MTDDLTPLTSKRLSAMKHDPATRILTVRFPNGAIYRYRDVPPEVHEKLLAADKDKDPDPNRSLGKLFHALVVKGGFDYEKVS